LRETLTYSMLIKLKGILGALTLCTILLLQGDCYAQNSGYVNFSIKKLSFIHPERNEIINSSSLDSFFYKLYKLKAQNTGRVNILQIGDSHIQADFLSAQVRTNFQHDFGNGGRGLVVPLRVAGTNEPFNYKITSNLKCSSKRCVFVNDPMPIGIGGVTIQSFSDSTYFTIKMYNAPSIDYAFKKITLFYLKDSAAYDYDVQDTSGNVLAQMDALSNTPYPNTAVAILPANTNQIVMQARKNNDYQNNTTIFGLNLENDSAGVLLHAVGVNGAEAFQYARAQYFAEQTAALQPNLIIVSLGTNEAQRRPFDKVFAERRLDSLVSAVQMYNPGVPVLLTTPPDSYYKRKYYNTSLTQLHEVMVNYAKQHDLAVWDLYSIAGGYKSAYSWKRSGLMRSDGIHFSRAGYEYQGNLLYEAITIAYNYYVKHRLP
jgi:lysophospholipase L1-like esterase